MMLQQEQKQAARYGGESRADQKNNDTSQERDDQQHLSRNTQEALLDQDRDQSTQLRGDEPVSELYIWGNDYYGQLGVGSDKVIHNLPKVCSFNIVVTDVSCGEEHTVFVQGDGGYVYAMGSNSEGRLGTGNPDMRSCNVPTLVDGLVNIKKVSCGSSHTLALSEDGHAYAWGQAFYGALGVSQRSSSQSNNLDNLYAPHMLDSDVFGGESIKDLEAGSRHSIFVTKYNQVYGCGDANQGQLGLGDANRDRVIEPTQIKDESFSGMVSYSISCGKYHTLMLVDNPREGNRRELWAFGANNFGQIGNNSTQNQFSPVRVDPRPCEDKMSTASRSHRFAKISAWHASAAVTDEGIMYVWGSGIFGEFKRPRKVKLQNNIRVQSVIIGGAFIVIVDQDNKVVVWGSNSNGEIGVGDTKVRNHPTRLETIEDKAISKVSVGGAFAFAIGKTTNRLENSIFDEVNRSQISNIQRNGAIEQTKDGEHDRNRSMNSLEEQLQQIALHSGSKKQRQDSSDKKKPPQDRSFGNYSSNNANGATSKFEQAANRVDFNKTSGNPTDARNVDDQVSDLRKMLEEKDKMIGDLRDQQSKKHEEYQNKLQRFKEMQEMELNGSNKLREENKRLREETDQLRDTVDQLRQEARDNSRKNERTTYSEPTGHTGPSQRYEPSSHPESGNDAERQPPHTFYNPRSSNTQPGETAAQYDKELASNIPAPSAQPGSGLHYSYEQRQSESHNIVRSSLDAQGLDMNDLKEKVTNEDQFKQQYLKGDHASDQIAQRSQQFDRPQGSEATSILSRYRDVQPSTYTRDYQSSATGPQRPQTTTNEGKLESAYKQRVTNEPQHLPSNKTSSYQGHNQHMSKNERISVDVDNIDRSQNSSAKKDYQRSFTAENPGLGGFMRQAAALGQRGGDSHQNYNLDANAHARHGSQHEDDRSSKDQMMTSNFARRGEHEQATSANQANRISGSLYSRDRINTGRVENLRSMGSELMRPGSQDGKLSNTGMRSKVDIEQQMRNSASGFYQPSAKQQQYNASNSKDYRPPFTNYDHNDLNAREDPSSTNNPGGLPDPSEIQNRLRQASRYSALEKSPDKVVRSLTPNADSRPGENNPLQNRVSYKPTYERLGNNNNNPHKDSKENGFERYSPAYPNAKDNNGHGLVQVKTDFSATQNMLSNQPQQQPQYQNSFKNRPGSGGPNRDPFYKTQNNDQSSSLKFENLADGFTSKYSRGDNTKASPGKPPRQDYNSFGSRDNGGGSMSTSGMSKPPTYNNPSKGLDYGTRYSYEPIGSKKEENQLTAYEMAQGPTNNNKASDPAQSYRFSLDAVKTQSSLNNIGQAQTPSYHQSRVDPRGSMDHHENTSNNEPQPPQYLKDLERNSAHNERLSASAFGSQTIDFSQKQRSPFAMQQLNDQLPSSYAHQRPDVAGKLGSHASSYAATGPGVTSLTPQGSGRRSGSIIENNPLKASQGASSSQAEGSEDIRSKLARYKKEREDFEMIRQQFRQKNSELGVAPATTSTTQGGNKPNQSLGGVSENTPAGNRSSHSGSHKQYQGHNASGGGVGTSNIFAGDYSGGGNNVQAFTTTSNAANLTNMVSGSPAFGLPESHQNVNNREQQLHH